MSTIDWEEINSKLPSARTDLDAAKRKELFKQFDPNDNRYLSLAEVRLGQFLRIDNYCYNKFGKQNYFLLLY
jgi:inorganic pyrophosphatase/exopolyphosphatase